jgi:hypothetical protein
LLIHTCCGELTPEARRANILLGLCARAEGNPLQYCRLIAQVDEFTEWSRLPSQAEGHGLGPLLYTHLHAVDALWPIETRRELMGLVLRHRHANTVRGRALGEILGAFEAAGIQVLVLKGAALAYLVYPQPGLRPMRDIDLLVKQPDQLCAQAILSTLGYQLDPDQARVTPADHHHLPGVMRKEEGLSVSVEVHHDLFPPTRYYHSLSYGDLIVRALPFDINGVTAYTLGYEDMLWHIYRHAVGPPLLASPIRYIWIADLVSLVEKFLDQIDWELVKRQYPQVWNILPLLHPLTPWSEAVLSKLRLEVSKAPQGVGEDYRGWPRRRDALNRRQLLQDTFSPSEWWLRLFYGVSGGGSWVWHRYVRHPFHILEWVGHYVKEKLSG